MITKNNSIKFFQLDGSNHYRVTLLNNSTIRVDVCHYRLRYKSISKIWCDVCSNLNCCRSISLSVYILPPSILRALPKSIMYGFNSPVLVVPSTMLSSLMSLCEYPRPCMNCSPLHTPIRTLVHCQKVTSNSCLHKSVQGHWFVSLSATWMQDMTMEWSDTQAPKQCGVMSPVFKAYSMAASDLTALQDTSVSIFFTQTVKISLYVICVQ